MTVVGLEPYLGPCCTPTTRRDLSHLEPKIPAAAVRTRSMTDLRKVTKDRGSRARVGVADGGLTSWSKTPHESAFVAGLAEYASHRAQTASVL